MTVVGLHPEELFDKLLEGDLTRVEAERLQQHLRGCEVCRFEYAARRDFQQEAAELAACPPPPTLTLRPLTVPGTERAAAPVMAPRRRARRRLLMVSLAAAALISASAAVAASVTGRAPWHTLGTLFSEPAPRTALPRGPAVAATPQSRPGAGQRKSGQEEIAVAAPWTSPTEARAVEPPREAPRPPVRRLLRDTQSSTRVEAETPPSREGPTKVTPVAAPEAQAVPEAPVKEQPSAAKLFGEANLARRSGDIGRASGLYHLLQDRYAGSPEAELSRVTLALLQLDSGDARAALAGFERYLAGSSRGLEAEALVGRARALGRVGRRSLEVEAWQEVQRKYPRSIYGRQATERLSALGQP